MVKNNKGGNRAKSMARKYANGAAQAGVSNIFHVDDECALYGQVQKMFGGNQCEVICDDGVVRRCVIRGKFRGYNKGSNMVKKNSFVLVGLREFMLKSGEEHAALLECDLLNIYTDDEKSRLKMSTNTIPWNLFPDSDLPMASSAPHLAHGKAPPLRKADPNANKIVQNSSMYMETREINDDGLDFVDDETYNIHQTILHAQHAAPDNRHGEKMIMDNGDIIDIDDI